MRTCQLSNPKWLAGFFDGEGCVSLVHTQIRPGYRIWRISISVSQNDKKLLLKLKDLYGGHVSKSGGKQYDVHQLIWVSKAADKILKLLKPLVVVKYRVIKLALEHRALINSNKKRAKVSKKILKRQKYIQKQIQRLNHQ